MADYCGAKAAAARRVKAHPAFARRSFRLRAMPQPSIFSSK
jgi:hypothetical protein